MQLDEHYLHDEVSEEFLQGMLDRMATSYYKYGKVSEGYPHNISALVSLEQRLAMYKSTRNREYLIDAANFLMIEFMFPSLAGAHYTPTDSDGSPGRTTKHGVVTWEANQGPLLRFYRRTGD